jgi:hypothetical protein
LDAGDGTASLWAAAPNIDLDGDGELDGIRIDLDGDGLLDDALTDGDDDGVADHAVLDLDDDGVAEAPVTDDGSGSWALAGGAAPRPPRWFGLDGAEHAGLPADVDGDGVGDRLLDVDRDGLADRALLGGMAQGYVDLDGDGGWDLILVDSDGDGAADGARRL